MHFKEEKKLPVHFQNTFYSQMFRNVSFWHLKLSLNAIFCSSSCVCDWRNYTTQFNNNTSSRFSCCIRESFLFFINQNKAISFNSSTEVKGKIINKNVKCHLTTAQCSKLNFQCSFLNVNAHCPMF